MVGDGGVEKGQVCNSDGMMRSGRMWVGSSDVVRNGADSDANNCNNCPVKGAAKDASFGQWLRTWDTVLMGSNFFSFFFPRGESLACDLVSQSFRGPFSKFRLL